MLVLGQKVVAHKYPKDLIVINEMGKESQVIPYFTWVSQYPLIFKCSIMEILNHRISK